MQILFLTEATTTMPSWPPMVVVALILCEALILDCKFSLEGTYYAWYIHTLTIGKCAPC